MVEPVGATLGVLGLAGLFSTCVDCFNIVQLGRAYAKDFEILQTKFEAQKLRFLIWGQVVGLDGGSSTYDARLDLPNIRPMIERILLNTQNLFSDETKLRRRYGLQPDDGTLISTGVVVFRDTYRRFQYRLSRTQKQAAFFTTIKWAISDKQKFTNLVQDVKDLIDALQDIMSSLQMLSRQRDLIAVEVGSVPDTASLRLLENALDPDDHISDAASQRLRLLQRHPESLTGTIYTEFSSLSVEQSFQTAPSYLPPSQEHDSSNSAGLSIADKTANLPQNKRLVNQAREQATLQDQLLVHTARSLTRPQVQKPSPELGATLKAKKALDLENTRTVLQKKANTSNPEEKRMVMILEKFIGEPSHSFLSLAPIGEDLLQILGRIEGPLSSPYQGGLFHVHISIPEEFPWMPPKCRFLTRIYHPNIDSRGVIDLPFLDPEHWPIDMMYLTPILIAILKLLDHPDIDDPLVPDIARQYIQDKTRFDEIAEDFTKKYANDKVPIVVPAGSGKGVGRPAWQTTFLRKRLADTRTRTATVIQALRCPPTENSNLSASTIESYLSLLFQLSSGLAAFTDDDGIARKFDILNDTMYEEMENFFDACGQEFRAVGIDTDWRGAFPNLPMMPNDATRGTGSSYLPKVPDTLPTKPLEVDGVIFGTPFEISSGPGDGSEVVEDWESGLDHGRGHHLGGLVAYARWLNDYNRDTTQSCKGVKRPYIGIRIARFFLNRGKEDTEEMSMSR